MMKKRPRGDAGFTLVETMISLTILLVACLLVFNLFHASLRYSSRVESQVLASIIAGKIMEEVRSWAWTDPGTGYNFHSSWSTWSGVAGTDDEHPEYHVRVDVRDAVFRSPCSTLEAPHYVERILLTSAKKVKVTVWWDENHPDRNVSTTTIIREPPKAFQAGTVTVAPSSPIPNPLPMNSSVSFTAAARDSGGNIMNDIFFKWYVEPIDGNGTMTAEARDGSTATFTNKVLLPDGTWGHTGGTCKVKARAVYRGIEKWGSSAVIHLGGP
jgi:prepilin-type N-terminal cleavage/methylation domain-containing protein